MNINLPVNEGLAYVEVGIKYSAGGVIYKAMPDDPSSNDQEEHVLDLFVKCYARLKYGISASTHYRIVGRDDGVTQQHDFSVEVSAIQERLDIEITMIGEDQGTHKSNRLRQQAFKANDTYNQKFFAFLPPSTNPRDVNKLFEQALILPPEDFPDMSTAHLQTLIDRLKSSGLPYVRINRSGIRQVHTTGGLRKPLREIVNEAIKKKEAKVYPGLDQSRMILLLDDQLLGYDREYLESVVGLLALEQANSTFKEIYIVSRKTSPSRRKNAVHEVMISPLKAVWYRPLYDAKLHVLKKLGEGETLPISY